MRYTIDDIRQMPEGQTFDSKSFHIEPKALANTIVAMANADGGMIAVGICSAGQHCLYITLRQVSAGFLSPCPRSVHQVLWNGGKGRA